MLRSRKLVIALACCHPEQNECSRAMSDSFMSEADTGF
jgi:hypothetical protein